MRALHRIGRHVDERGKHVDYVMNSQNQNIRGCEFHLQNENTQIGRRKQVVYYINFSTQFAGGESHVEEEGTLSGEIWYNYYIYESRLLINKEIVNMTNKIK